MSESVKRYEWACETCGTLVEDVDAVLCPECHGAPNPLHLAERVVTEAVHTREVRRLRKALEWIQERCSVIGSLTPCYPLASGLWDVCDKALAADQGETGGSDDKG